MRATRWVSLIPLFVLSEAVCISASAEKCSPKRMKHKQLHIPDIQGLLTLYLFSGVAAMVSFIACAALLLTALRHAEASYVLLGMSLLAGFLWIGSTSVCRHSLLLLKDEVGLRVEMREFLATQFVFFLFPFAYRKIKKEIRHYGERSRAKKFLYRNCHRVAEGNQVISAFEAEDIRDVPATAEKRPDNTPDPLI
jgi:hypothetical protein